jgi:hypothetical protein
MATPPLSDELALEAVRAFHAHGSKAAAAVALGLKPNTYDTRLARGQARGLEKGFVRDAAPPSPHIPIQEQVERLRRDYILKQAHATATKLLKMNITVSGPIGLLAFGDPHLSSPLTDWVALTRDIELVKKTPGLFGTNIGDTGDNWTGKLAHLWADNEVSHTTEVRLVKWFMEEIPWMLVLYGNHCLWSGAGSVLPWLAEQQGILDANWSQRIALEFPNGRQVRIGCYHGANGHSMWNAVHGGIKLAKMGPRDHLICAGHIHKSQVLYPIVDPDSGDWASVLQLGSYKNLSDNYGKRLGGGEQNAFPSAVVIINPAATTPAGLLRIFPDTEEGADFLTYLRRKKS